MNDLIAGYVAAIAISTTAAIVAQSMRALARDSEARRMLLKSPEAARLIIVVVILGVSVGAAAGARSAISPLCIPYFFGPWRCWEASPGRWKARVGVEPSQVVGVFKTSSAR